MKSPPSWKHPKPRIMPREEFDRLVEETFRASKPTVLIVGKKVLEMIRGESAR